MYVLADSNIFLAESLLLLIESIGLLSVLIELMLKLRSGKVCTFNFYYFGVSLKRVPC